jgi:hypothetical protein
MTKMKKKSKKRLSVDRRDLWDCPSGNTQKGARRHYRSVRE